MDIEKFSRQAIDKYKENARKMGAEDAKLQAVYSAASSAADQDRVGINNAAKTARHAIEAYETKSKGGLAETAATDGAAKDTANRFDDRARDNARSQERPKSRGMSL